jgi:hypothetical protein
VLEVTAADIDGDSDLDMLSQTSSVITLACALMAVAFFAMVLTYVVVREPAPTGWQCRTGWRRNLDMLVANFAGNSVSVRFVSALTDLII